MLKKRLRSGLPERIAPGDPEEAWGSPGSIEQKLDMCEEGELRGDQIEHAHGRTFMDPEMEGTPEGGKPLDQLIQIDTEHGRFQLLKDPDREDDELTGDEHSLGLQGDESELNDQDHIENGLPGDEGKKDSNRTRNYQPWD